MPPIKNYLTDIFVFEYSWGLNTEHWNTEHIGVPSFLKFCFPMVQKQDGCHFVLFSNGPDHWKIEFLASLDHFFMIRQLEQNKSSFLN